MNATATRKRKPARRSAKPVLENIAELLAQLGVPPERVRLSPPPGTATKKDLIRVHNTIRRCELVEGTLVENPMGQPESFLAFQLIRLIGRYLDANDIGYGCAPDALVELMPNVVRGPDVCFTPWSATPDGFVPQEQISKLIPPLVVEILSPSNTRAEIDRKIGEYFTAGVVLVWVIDPPTRSAVAYTAPDAATTIRPTDTLTGDPVLPGFTLPLATLFANFRPSEKPAKPPRKKKK